MQALDKKAATTFRKLVAGLTKVGDHRKVANNVGFMAVCVEVIDQQEGNRIVSIAHYYEQEGDLMRDPDMTFLVADQVYPLTYRQDGAGIWHEAVWWENEKIMLRVKMQRDITCFANQWMRNIEEQQYA